MSALTRKISHCFCPSSESAFEAIKQLAASVWLGPSCVLSALLTLTELSQVLEGIDARIVPITPSNLKRIASHGAHFYRMHVVGNFFGDNAALARDLIYTECTVAVDAKQVDGIDALMPVAPGDA